MFGWGRPEACKECEALRAEVKRLRADVEDIGDKVFHWMKRHSARAARGDVGPGAPTATADPERDTGAMDGAGPVSPRVAALLARRRNAIMANGSS